MTADEPGFQEPPHWELLGTLIWGSVIMAVFFILQMVVVAFSVIPHTNGLSEAEVLELFISAGESGNVLFWCTLTTAIVGIICIAAAVKLKKGSVLRNYLAIKPVPLKTIFQWIGLLLVFIVITDLITISIGRPLVPDFMTNIYTTSDPIWMLWFTLLIAAPIFEETFFRGFLFKGFESSFMGPFGAIFITAALWASLHVQYDLYLITILGLSGLIIGAARFYTGSLLVPLALHMVMNFVATAETIIVIRLGT